MNIFLVKMGTISKMVTSLKNKLSLFIEISWQRRSFMTIPSTLCTNKRQDSWNWWKTQQNTHKISHQSVRSWSKVQYCSKRTTVKREIHNPLRTKAVQIISVPILRSLKVSCLIRWIQKLLTWSETLQRKVCPMKMKESFLTCLWLLIGNREKVTIKINRESRLRKTIWIVKRVRSF